MLKSSDYGIHLPGIWKHKRKQVRALLNFHSKNKTVITYELYTKNRYQTIYYSYVQKSY